MSKKESHPVQKIHLNQPYYSLDIFYSELLSKEFETNIEAINFCRELCSRYGFTVKQEQSTHKNIYVYCSREGLPDSHRNPKANPQRNRPSQRCECRWRVVLYENNRLMWEFRKSQNSDAFVHNHKLMKPEEIKKDWPREVCEMIFELARERLPTHEIRQRVKKQYPAISWDDRRFYNRLSEERQKMKQRDIAARTRKLLNMSAKICMLNAGSEDLSRYVESKLTELLEDTCRFTGTCLDSLEGDHQSEKPFSSKKSFESLPKGYIAVTIPESTLQIKMHHHNSTGDIRRSIFDCTGDGKRTRAEPLSDPPATKIAKNLDQSCQSNLIYSEPVNYQDPRFYLPSVSNEYNPQYSFDLDLINLPNDNRPHLYQFVDSQEFCQSKPTRSVDKKPPFNPNRPIVTFTTSDSFIPNNLDPFINNRPFLQQQFRRSSGPN